MAPGPLPGLRPGDRRVRGDHRPARHRCRRTASGCCAPAACPRHCPHPASAARSARACPPSLPVARPTPPRPWSWTWPLTC